MSPRPLVFAPLPPKQPSAISEAAARALEDRAEQRGNGTAATVQTRQSAAVAEPNRSKLRRAARGVRVAGYLPHELEAALHDHCARERRSTSDALTEAVRLLLGR